jgi:hypothetical protein
MRPARFTGSTFPVSQAVGAARFANVAKDSANGQSPLLLRRRTIYESGNRAVNFARYSIPIAILRFQQRIRFGRTDG